MKPDPVKAKIQSLCPEVMAVHECNCPSAEDIVGFPITLAVVLRAIGHSNCKMPTFDVYGNNFGIAINRDKTDYYDRVKWNLEKDNYDDQDEATKAFIGSLILNV